MVHADRPHLKVRPYVVSRSALIMFTPYENRLIKMSIAEAIYVVFRNHGGNLRIKTTNMKTTDPADNFPQTFDGIARVGLGKVIFYALLARDRVAPRNNFSYAATDLAQIIRRPYR